MYSGKIELNVFLEKGIMIILYESRLYRNSIQRKTTTKYVVMVPLNLNQVAREMQSYVLGLFCHMNMISV